MAVVTVGFAGVRLNALDTTTDITGIGGGAGAGVETDVYYQNGAAISRKVTNGGFAWEPATAPITTTTWNLLMTKVFITNYEGVTTAQFRWGADNTNYWFGSVLSYLPSLGGWAIFAQDLTGGTFSSGSPVATPGTYDYFAWALVGNTSKAENLVVDALEVGDGLYFTGGTSPNTPANFDDFLTFEGANATSTNRYGCVVDAFGAYLVVGTLRFGASVSVINTVSAVASRFSDSNKTVIFRNGDHDYDTRGLIIHLNTSGSDMRILSCVFLPERPGTVTGGVFDGRYDVTFLGNLSNADIEGTTFSDVRRLTLTSSVTGAFNVVGASGRTDDVQSNISGSSFSTTQLALSGSNTFIWDIEDGQVRWVDSADPNGDLDNCDFSRTADTNVGPHAIYFESQSLTTVTLTGCSFTGYDATANGTTTSRAATFYVAKTTGTVTINLDNCTSSSGFFSVKSAGATVNLVINPVPLLVRVIDTQNNPAAFQVVNARVLVLCNGPPSRVHPTETTGNLTWSSNVARFTGTANFPQNGDFDELRVGDKILVEGATQLEYNGIKTLTAVSATWVEWAETTALSSDTGSITFVYIDALTSTSGIVQGSTFIGQADQPVRIKVRRATPTETAYPAGVLYKAVNVPATISESTGLNQTISLVRDT